MNSENQPTSNDILCIEDNEAFVYALRALVDSRVHSASTLEAGIHKLRSRKWNSVVLDLVLPDSTMEQTIGLIPSIVKMAAPAPVIVMTGYCVSQSELKGLGASEVAEKTDPRFAQILLRALA